MQRVSVTIIIVGIIIIQVLYRTQKSYSPHSGSFTSSIKTWVCEGEMAMDPVLLTREILTKKLSFGVSHISSLAIESVRL